MIKVTKEIASELLALHEQTYTPVRGTHVPAPANICGVVARYVDLDAPERLGWTLREWLPVVDDSDEKAALVPLEAARSLSDDHRLSLATRVSLASTLVEAEIKEAEAKAKTK